jgi:Fe(3+) dicitrate transport protein
MNKLLTLRQLEIFFVIIISLSCDSVVAVEILDTVEVIADPVIKEDSLILEGKKTKVTSLKDLPPVQLDSTRQVFSSQPGIHTPEQTTEPWMVLNYRGLGSPQEAQGLLILQDGLPVALDMYGSPDHYYAPPAPLMERIEVIAGGSALLYGPTPSATVNFLSPTLSKNMSTRGRLNVAGGSYNLFSTVNTLVGSKNNLSYYVSYHRKQGDGLQRINGDFAADYIESKAKYFSDNNFIFKTSLQAHNSDFGMPGGMSLDEGPGLNTWGDDNRTATRTHNRLRLRRVQLMIGGEKKLSEKTLIDVEIWSNAYRKYNKTQLGSGFGKFPTSSNNVINTTDSYGFNAQVKLRHEYGDHTFTSGYLSYNSNSPAVNEEGNRPDANHGRVTSRLYRTTRAQAVFAENSWQLGKYTFVPGLRFENISLNARNNDKENSTKIDRSDTYNVFLWGFGNSYKIESDLKLFFNLSRGFRPLGYEEVLSQGNPNYSIEGDLRPSYSDLYEIGINRKNQKLDWSISLYLIRRGNILASTANRLSNGSTAEYKGVELSLSMKPFSRISFFANYNFMNARYERGSFSGKTPAHAPASLFKSGVTYAPSDSSRISLLNTYVHEHFSDDAHTSDYKVPSYHLQDLLGEYFLSNKWSINVSINNLMDLNYYGRVMPTGVMPTMGRNVSLGFNYMFGI